MGTIPFCFSSGLSPKSEGWHSWWQSWDGGLQLPYLSPLMETAQGPNAPKRFIPFLNAQSKTSSWHQHTFERQWEHPRWTLNRFVVNHSRLCVQKPLQILFGRRILNALPRWDGTGWQGCKAEGVWSCVMWLKATISMSYELAKLCCNYRFSVALRHEKAQQAPKIKRCYPGILALNTVFTSYLFFTINVSYLSQDDSYLKRGIVTIIIIATNNWP